MAFYFQPVSGNISLKKLEIFAVNRLRFLIQTNQLSDNRLRMLDLVNSLHSVADSECLIEGSQKDNISHFILRLLFVDEETEHFFVSTESNLFKFRFSCLTENEIYKTLKRSQKHLRLFQGVIPCCYDSKNIHHVLYTLQALRQSAGCWKNVAHCYIHGRSRNQFQVPFQAVTSLVARRRVQIHKGMALVSYDDLEEVLTGLFWSALKLSLSQIEEKQEMTFGDSRMKRLSQKLKMIYRREVPTRLIRNDLPCLSHDQVDQSEALFPPCMSNLHHNLRTSHRLKHNDRIQYTLFLKEAGMPVHHAVTFWSQEYSQPGMIPDSHSWQSDGPRYLYNIRHLYGLEGARRNYRGHCCSSLQRRQLGPFEQGGCPFVHFDDGSLGNLLTTNRIRDEDKRKLLKLREEGHPCEACKVYLTHKIDSRWTTVSEKSKLVPSFQEQKELINGACGQSEQHSQDACSKTLIKQDNVHNDQMIVCNIKGSESVKRKNLLADNETHVNNRCSSCKHNRYALGHGRNCFPACHFDDSDMKKCETHDEVGDMHCSTNDVIDVDLLGSCSSDDDVVCLKVTTNRRTKKRPSLSSKGNINCKKQILWYESRSNDRASHQVNQRHDRALSAYQVDIDCRCTETASKIRSRACSNDSNESVLKLENIEHGESETSRQRETSFSPEDMLNRNSNTRIRQSLLTQRTLAKGGNSCRHLLESDNEDSRNVKCLEHPSQNTYYKGDVSEISSTNANCSGGDNSCSAHSLDNMKVHTIKDEESCFEHDFCQSQVDSNSIARKLSELKTVNTQSLTDRLQTVHIHKPVDFYLTFRELLTGLTKLYRYRLFQGTIPFYKNTVNLTVQSD